MAVKGAFADNDSRRASRRTLANAIRVLSMDAVQRASCGHPGMPMGMADIAEVLWNDFLVHNPADPAWPNRDRFVVSNGHGSMLLYALLHLSGYDLPMQQLENFRQLHSTTPGHPEYGETPGVETTTGPLGQGLANAVGMAIAEMRLAAEFNQPDFPLIDHFTYVFLGDGCLMEGISHEACSLAGTLQLGKLIALYDDNGISIDGEVQGWFTDDTAARFEAYGWQVITAVEGHDSEAVRAALAAARKCADKPTLIVCKTVIGWGSPNKQGTAGSHGAALGEAEIAATRQQLDWDLPPFEMPAEVYSGWDARQQGAQRQQVWQTQFEAYAQAFPTQAAELTRRLAGELPADFAKHAQDFIHAVQTQGPAAEETRKASLRALEGLAPRLPELLGGSADLTGSNCTRWSGCSTLTADHPSGNYLNYGVREFAMSAIANGMLLHGGIRPYTGTFLVFSDYARNAVRMAALMKIANIFVYTHDSIGVGEDGPTHQPVEHAASLRLIPELDVWRPCDSTETAAAWQAALQRRNGPSCLLLTRQKTPAQPRTQLQLENISRGAYVLRDSTTDPRIILLATGSEIAHAVSAATALEQQGYPVRVVSMPCAEVFQRQSRAYREAVLPPDIRARVAIEAGVSNYWHAYTGLDGAVIGIDRFGASAPIDVLYEHLGLTTEAIIAAAENCVKKLSPQ